MDSNKTFPTGIQRAIQAGKDVLILNDEISVLSLAGKMQSICYMSFCSPSRKINKKLFKITYYNKLGFTKFEEICYEDMVIKRFSQLKYGLINLRAL